MELKISNADILHYLSRKCNLIFLIIILKKFKKIEKNSLKREKINFKFLKQFKTVLCFRVLTIPGNLENLPRVSNWIPRVSKSEDSCPRGANFSNKNLEETKSSK